MIENSANAKTLEPKAAPLERVALSTLPERPLVSVIIPSYNQGRFIRETIDSLLDQDYRPIEILVMDGASTDETIDVLKSYGGTPELKWTSEPDNGVVEAVNKGFAKARGVIGAIQSSDDFYLPGAIKTGVSELRLHQQLGFVFGDVVKIDVDGNELSRHVLGPFSVEGVLSRQTWIPQPSCFFRMDLAKMLGGWREQVPYSPDTDLWYRMMLRTKARKIDAFLAVRRMHGEQRDTQGATIIRDYTQMIEDWFALFHAPERYRPAAEAGVLLTRNRYSDDEDQSIQMARARRAVRLYPDLKHQLNLPSRIPGLTRVRRYLGRCRRALRFG